jgi:hypothetical protein
MEGTMNKKDAIVDILNRGIEGTAFRVQRDWKRKRWVFLADIDSESQYMLAILDKCLEDRAGEEIENAVRKATPALKANPNLVVVIKADLSVEVGR